MNADRPVNTIRKCLGVLALVGALSVTGCPRPPIIPKKVPGLLRSQVLHVLNSRAKKTATLRARLSVNVRTARMRRTESCGGALRVQYPDRLRLRGYHDLLDYPPFDIGSDGRWWFFHVHFEDTNEIHVGTVRALEERFDPQVPLRPIDIVTALGIGRLEEVPGRRELLFTRHPGYYLFTEVVTNRSGRYIARRITVAPERLVITKLETFRPDGAIDMIADVSYDSKDEALKEIPTSVRLVVLREEQFLLELRLRDRRIGEPLKPKTFQTPDTSVIPKVIPHGIPSE